MSIPIFIINLPNSTDRRNSIESQFQSAGLDYEIIEAVNGHKIDLDNTHYDRNKRLQYFGRDLTPGEIGCLLSHRKIYEKMVKENISKAIVFEDDIVLKDQNFQDLMDTVVGLNSAWDVIRFLEPKRRCRIIRQFTPGYALTLLYGIPGGAHAYLLTLKAAKTMLEHTERPWLPIDTLLGRTWQTKLEVLYLSPSPVATDARMPSTIGDDRFDKTPRLRGIKRTLFPLFRACYKLNENFHKRAHYWFYRA